MNAGILLRRWVPLLVILIFTACSRAVDLPVAEQAAPKEYASLLKNYISPDGVRYAAWKQNPGDLAALKKVTEFFANTQPPRDRDAALAWHLNAYNAWILHSILERYPTKGPLSSNPLFFITTRIVISGKKTNFDHFEQKVIRPVFNEPRIHFALNCASASCPPLAARPFAGESLGKQLDELTRAFVNTNVRALSLENGHLSLSKIFDWYKDDFSAVGGTVAFINRYRKEPFPANVKIKFLDYDWSLNEAR